jgi:hypothetical protein
MERNVTPQATEQVERPELEKETLVRTPNRSGGGAHPGRRGPVPGVRGAAATAVVTGLTAALCACVSVAARPTDGGSAPVSKTAGPQVPAFASDLGRVCADGLGFPGLPAYEPAPGKMHPAVLMDKRKDTWSQNVPLDGDFPSGWIIGYDGDVRQTELMVCYERTGATPAGKSCEMKDNKTGEPLTLTLYNTTYRLRVLEAQTGRTLYKYNGKAVSTTCPLFTYTTSGDDRTRHYTEDRPADYRKRIKRFIAP